MRFALSFLLSLSIGSQAMALSCARPSAGGMFQMASDAEESFYVAKGTLTHVRGRRTARQDAQGMGIPFTATARFDGHLGTKAGFTHAHSAPVKINVECIVHWCGGMPEGEQIYFLEITDTGLVFNAGACPTHVLPSEPKTERILKGCLAGRGCDVNEF